MPDCLSDDEDGYCSACGGTAIDLGPHLAIERKACADMGEDFFAAAKLTPAMKLNIAILAEAIRDG